VRLPGLFDRISIRSQVTLATAALAIILVLGATIGTASLGRRILQKAAGDELTQLAEVMASRLDRGMFERYREIGTIVSLDALRNAWEYDANALRAVLDGMQQSYPDYAWIGFARTDGTVVAATKGMLEGASVAQRPWFIDGVQKPFAGDVHEALLLAKMLGPRTDNEPFRFVDVAYPVRNATGDIIGVLGAHLSWDWATEVRRSLQTGEGQSSQADVSILDSKGKVLLGRNINSVMLTPEQLAAIRAKPSGAGLAYGTDAAEWLTGYAVAQGYRDYPGLDWIVIARLPVAVANRPVQDLVGSILMIGLALGVFGIAMARWLARRVTEPIHRLSREADRIGRDAGAHTLPRVGGAREVMLLSQSLRSLLRRVGQAEHRLEVAAREAMAHEAEARELVLDIERLRKLSETDPLTGLLNRRAFLSAAERQVAYARRYDRGLAIVVADIDHFKHVNDGHGHATGDAVIRAVAARLQTAARDTDLVARFGGEEFVVLLMESDITAAVSYAERARGLISAAPVAAESGAQVRVTLSLGCTILSDNDHDVQDAIDRADDALYGAKAAGRNRVRVSLQALQGGAAAAS
jgi:diguanylate cyclase (GGDEF)-like protein